VLGEEIVQTCSTDVFVSVDISHSVFLPAISEWLHSIQTIHKKHLYLPYITPVEETE